ncbi:MAG: protein kinase [Deltaproteobacteria bacterium]
MDATSITPHEGMVVDNFRLEQRLGKGGMGVVFAARDVRLDRRVAIKFLDPVLARDEDFRRRFLREARAAAKLMHPNVAAIFDSGETDEHLYMVMQLVDGETLAARLRRSGALPVAEAVDVGRQIAAALQAAHEQRLLHRDLKPDNIVVSASGHVAVLDFGLAKQLDRGASPITTTAGKIIGTPGYIAPEQLAGDELDERGDLYALGCVLFEMISGRRAFVGDTPIAVLVAQGQDEVPPLDQLRDAIPAPLVEVVARCLCRDRDARPRSAHEVEVALAALAPTDEAPPSRSSWSTPRTVPSMSIVTPPSRRAWFVVSALLAVVAAAVVIGLQEDEATDPVLALPETMSAWGLNVALRFTTSGRRYLRCEEDRVLVADLDGRQLVGWRSPPGASVFDAVWSPDGRWLAISLVGADDGRQRVVRLDVESGRVRDLVPSGHVLAIDPAGERLLVLTSSELVVTDVAGGRLTSVEALGYVNCASWGPDVDQLVVGAADATGRFSLHRVDPRSGRHVRLDTRASGLNLGNCAVVGLPDDRWIYAEPNVDGPPGARLTLHNPTVAPDPPPFATFPGANIRELQRTDDGRLLVTKGLVAMEVRVGDLELDPLRVTHLESLPTLSHDRVSDWTADGARILATRRTDAGYAIYTLDDAARSWGRPTWSVDGTLSSPIAIDETRHLAWSVTRTAPTSTIAVARLVLFEAGRPPRLGPKSLVHEVPAEHVGRPEPRKVAVACAKGSSPRCYIVDVRGSHLVLHRYDPDRNALVDRRDHRELRVPRRYAMSPSLAVRSRQPAVAITFEGRVYVIAGDAKRARRLALDPGMPTRVAQYLDWVPNRDALVVSVLEHDSSLVVIDLDETEHPLVEPTAGWVCCPRVSPDGVRIAFSTIVGTIEVVRVAVPDRRATAEVRRPTESAALRR